MLKLVIQDDEGKTTVVPLIRDEITIGRKEGNTIRLTERNVSRRHARILRTTGAITIEDLDSYNGVKVNGSRIQGRAAVAESDRVQIGDYLIELKTEGKEDGKPAVADDDETRPHPTKPLPKLVDPVGATPVPEATAVVNVQDPGFQPDVETPPAVAATHPATSPARVVVLSTNFAGQEFVLDQPAMVIGRTNDNEIWLNHRSISRHHARIVQENGRWAIVDLQSSNGVRVNGEEYGKVELRRGDVIDLGHVRFRFVEPGEDFVFSRDAQPVDIAVPKGGRSFGWFMVVALILTAAVVIYMISRDTDRAGLAGDVSDAAPRVAEVAIDAAAIQPADAVAAPDPNSKVAELLGRAREAIAAKDWSAAEKAAVDALLLDTESREAAEIKKKAAFEGPNANIYEQLEAAAGRRAYRDIKALAAKIPATSEYAALATSRVEEIVDAYVAELVDLAEKKKREGRCADIRKLAKGAVFAAARQPILEAGAGCKATTTTPVVVVKPPVEKTCKAGEKLVNGKCEKPPEKKCEAGEKLVNGKCETTKTAKELADEARQAYMSGQLGKSRRLCTKALAKESGNRDARTICALTGCKLKNAALARRHAGKLDSGRKTMVRQVCLGAGISLD